MIFNLLCGIRKRRAYLTGSQPLIFLGLACLPLSAPAHHSVNGIFDAGNVIELEGKVVEVAWQNPHVRFTVTVGQEGGQDKLWNV